VFFLKTGSYPAPQQIST